MTPRFDCQACGACCCNTERNIKMGSQAYVEVPSSDELNKQHRTLLKQLAVRDDGGFWFLKIVGDDHRCVALEGEVGAGVGCAIYKLRPSGCRRVEAGDEECLRARRFKGLSLISER